MAQLKTVANLKFLLENKEKEYIRRSVSISYSNRCVFHTLCCLVQTSSPSRFQFNSRKTFSNVSTYNFFPPLETLLTQIQRVLLHDSVEGSRVLHFRKESNGPINFKSRCQTLTTFTLPPAFENLAQNTCPESPAEHQLFTNKITFFCSLTYCFPSLPIIQGKEERKINQLTQ